MLAKLQKAVVTYYNDLTVTLTQFAQHCMTNDQQIRTCLKKRDRVLKKLEDVDKTSSRQMQLSRAFKLTSIEKAAVLKNGTSTSETESKCYNCFELRHLLQNCSKLKTKRTKQVLAAKLTAVSASTKETLVIENEEL
ncbi:MAG: hypothetical protein M1813_002010 [Trichoglossum hirsutum]|nr:MAG: hypothetical protein M1813_002010 [Trichoglossum hirsutum]